MSGPLLVSTGFVSLSLRQFFGDVSSLDRTGLENADDNSHRFLLYIFSNVGNQN
jgi:hypothetical protein